MFGIRYINYSSLDHHTDFCLNSSHNFSCSDHNNYCFGMHLLLLLYRIIILQCLGYSKGWSFIFMCLSCSYSIILFLQQPDRPINLSIIDFYLLLAYSRILAIVQHNMGHLMPMEMCPIFHRLILAFGLLFQIFIISHGFFCLSCLHTFCSVAGYAAFY